MFKFKLFLSIKLFVLLASFLLLIAETKAADIAGADIYYEYVSPLTYRVHLKLYRDCAGLDNLKTTDSITIISPLSSNNFKIMVDTATANDPNNGVYFRNTPSAAIPTRCTDPQSIYPGFQYFHLVGEVTLPIASNDWEFSWSSCCRGSNITNIADSSICVRAGLNNTDRAINSSVVLTVQPTPNMEIQQPVIYLNGPVDPDFDSTVTVFRTPGSIPLGLSSGCVSTQFITPFTAVSPITSSSPYFVNPVTGTVAFTPTATGKYVLSFRTTDYDKTTGIQMGFVEREVQLYILNILWPAYLSSDSKLNQSITLYPNPANNTLNIKLSEGVHNGRIDFHVYNSIGKKVHSFAMFRNEALDIGFLPVGFYYLEVNMDDQVLRKVFLKE